MKSNIYSHLTFSAVASLFFMLLFLVTFFAVEPAVSRSQVDTNDFTIQQTILDESSFLVSPANVSMSGSINGVTGGNATGTTYFVVQSNNVAGYYVEIDFFDNGTEEAMLGDDTDSEAIRDYDGATMTPSFGFTASTAAQFAYTVTSSSSADTSQNFLDNTTVCGVGATQTAETCWMAPSTTAYEIVDRDSSAASGATSTIQFKVHVPNGAVPVPNAETYTATATLSLFLK